MSRPETITDLPEIDRYAPVVTIHSVDMLCVDGDAMREMAQLCDLLSESTWLDPMTGGDDHCVYSRKKTRGEDRATLEAAQRRWDWRQGLYDRAAAGEALRGYERVYADEHARSEGLEPIDWEALDAAEAEEVGEGR